MLLMFIQYKYKLRVKHIQELYGIETFWVETFRKCLRLLRGTKYGTILKSKRKRKKNKGTKKKNKGTKKKNKGTKKKNNRTKEQQNERTTEQQNRATEKKNKNGK